MQDTSKIEFSALEATRQKGLGAESTIMKVEVLEQKQKEPAQAIKQTTHQLTAESKDSLTTNVESSTGSGILNHSPTKIEEITTLLNTKITSYRINPFRL